MADNCLKDCIVKGECAMERILIVEEDFALAEKLCGAFSDEETAAVTCGSIEAALTLAAQLDFRVVILDEILPDGNSIDFIEDIKSYYTEKNDISVILLVPNEYIEDIVTAYMHGADDCVSKPFSTAALKARVATQLKKRKYMYNFEASRRFDAIGSASEKGIRGEHMVAIGKYMFDFDRQEFLCFGESVPLSGTEQGLLKILVENKGVVLKRAALMERMKSETGRDIGEPELVDTVITLRDKLDAGDYIKTVYGMGYMWANHVMT